MPTLIRHRKVNILILEAQDSIQEHCSPGDIAIVQDEKGWWTMFIGKNGKIDSYDIPFDSQNKALWAAKAAAEFGF